MKNKTKFVSIVLFLSAFVMLASFGEQKVEWKGKIEIENGVKVIKNPREPLYGEIKFELEEDLSIGRDDDDNYMFYGVGDIELDSKENIYVADKRNYRIQKFDNYYLYKTTLPKYTYVVKNGYLYAREIQDEELVKRFRIKNWDKIKEGI